MNCCNDYGDCRQGRDCPARSSCNAKSTEVRQVAQVVRMQMAQIERMRPRMAAARGEVSERKVGLIFAGWWAFCVVSLIAIAVFGRLQ
jgi:hypothetical protein